jgi:hypothetical protein
MYAGKFQSDIITAAKVRMIVQIALQPSITALSGIFIYIYMFIYMYVHMNANTYVCTCICIYIYKHV